MNSSSAAAICAWNRLLRLRRCGKNDCLGKCFEGTEGWARCGRRADTYMPERESEAIVLRSFPLGEADRMVSFLCRTAGRLRGVARGARRPRSRFGSTLEMLSHVRIWYYERETRELVRISQCELMESFLEAQRDYAAGLALALVSEVTEAVLPEREATETFFRLVLLTARAVKEEAPLAIPLCYFNFWTLRLGGWLPRLDTCSRCGRPLAGGAVYGSASFAGLFCLACRTPDGKMVSGPSLVLAARLTNEKLERLVKERSESFHDLNEYLLDLIEQHIEKKLSTRRLMEAPA